MICRICGFEGIPDDFPFRNKSKGLRKSLCKECQYGYQKKWYKKNSAIHKKNTGERRDRVKSEIRTYIRNIKDVPCTDCGKEFHWFAMDFDHLRDKDVELSLMQTNSYSLDRIKKEIAKCEVVCAVCHRLRTAKEMDLL